MEGEEILSGGFSKGMQVDGKVAATFHKSFGQVQKILDQNRLLIRQINQNQESNIPHDLGRNVGLIRELNNNIRRVVDLYAHLSTSFATPIDVLSEAESSETTKSDSKAAHKRFRSA